MKNKLCGLYAITPETGDPADLLSRVDAALSGGCRILQYRDKLSAMPERVARARALRELTRRHGARLLINDDLALCRLVEADGVHLGEDDGNLRAYVQEVDPTQQFRVGDRVRIASVNGASRVTL